MPQSSFHLWYNAIVLWDFLGFIAELGALFVPSSARGNDSTGNSLVARLFAAGAILLLSICGIWAFVHFPGAAMKVILATLLVAFVMTILACFSFLKYQRRATFARGFCRSCGYNLTGNTSGKCPECGQRL